MAIIIRRKTKPYTLPMYVIRIKLIVCNYDLLSIGWNKIRANVLWFIPLGSFFLFKSLVFSFSSNDPFISLLFFFGQCCVRIIKFSPKFSHHKKFILPDVSLNIVYVLSITEKSAKHISFFNTTLTRSFKVNYILRFKFIGRNLKRCNCSIFRKKERKTWLFGEKFNMNWAYYLYM